MKNKVLPIFSAVGIYLGFVGVASAALPTSVGTAFTGLQTDALALLDMVWDPLIAITIAFIILRLFPKAANKAV